MGHTKRNCDHCKSEYLADNRNLKRGWGLCCSKSCASKKRERLKPGYCPERVAKNNIRRELWNHSTPYGVSGYTSEGYKIINGVAYDEFDQPIYDVSEVDDHDRGWDSHKNHI